MRPRRFILPQAGTDGEGHVFPCCVCRGDHWSPVNLPPQRIFRDSFLVRQAGTGEQCSPLQIFFDSLSPKYSCPPHVSLPHRLRAEPSRRGGQESVALSPFVENGIRRGAFYMRPRRFILPQTGTGGYGIRPYVFETAAPLAEGTKRGRCPARSFLPLSKTESVGAPSICARGG